jgi:alpha-tubulin suppressor-like RCC1 family protein
LTTGEKRLYRGLGGEFILRIPETGRVRGAGPVAVLVILAGCACREPGPPVGGDTSTGTSGDTGSIHASGSTGETAVPPPLPLTWLEADAGGNHSCGLVSDGSVRCWGHTSCLEGLPDPALRFRTIAAGDLHTIGIREDGGLTAWCCDYSSFCSVALPDGTFDRVVSGHEWSCVRQTDGDWKCLAPNHDTPFLPLQIDPLEKIQELALDSERGAVLYRNGRVVEFANSPLDEPIWTEQPPADVKFTAVSRGRLNGVGLDAEGIAWCWGEVWGIETMRVPCVADPGPFVEIESYHQLNFGIRADRTLAWWGWEYQTDAYALPSDAFAQVGAGEYFVCGATVDGRALCWGDERGGPPNPAANLQPPDLNE